MSCEALGCGFCFSLVFCLLISSHLVTWQANPGVWNVRLAPNKHSEIYEIDKSLVCSPLSSLLTSLLLNRLLYRASERISGLQPLATRRALNVRNHNFSATEITICWPDLFAVIDPRSVPFMRFQVSSFHDGFTRLLVS